MPGKILVIEDDPTSLRLIEYALKQRGYQVLTTLNGMEGIITAQKEEPDLIMLDIMLPGIDGFEVCRRLHAGSQTARVPILIISAKTQKEDINAGFRAGADDYLPKPASPTEIINRVESLLARKISGQAKVIPFINSGQIPGMATITYNVAAAINEQGKQVTLVDASGYQKEHSIQNADSKPANQAILEADGNHNGSHNGSNEPGFITLPSGIRVLNVDEVSEGSSVLPDTSLELVKKISKANDYLLVVLPLKPSAFTSTILTGSDLAIIVSDYRIENIQGIKNTITLLRFLGITSEKIAAVLVDPEGRYPNLTANNLKPYIEANLGVTLAEVLSFDAKLHQSYYMDSQPLIQSTPNQKIAQDIRQIARYIMTFGYEKEETPKSVTDISTLERKN
jgi:DNA-binding response OmpR family regulator